MPTIKGKDGDPDAYTVAEADTQRFAKLLDGLIWRKLGPHHDIITAEFKNFDVTCEALDLKPAPLFAALLPNCGEGAWNYRGEKEWPLSGNLEIRGEENIKALLERCPAIDFHGIDRYRDTPGCSRH